MCYDRSMRNTRKNIGKARMPRRSHYATRAAWEDACWNTLLGSRLLLGSLVTPSERRNLILRATVMDSIHSGKRFKQIVEEFGLAPQTVSSIKKAVGGGGYHSYRERGKTERKRRQYSPRPASSKPKRPEGKPQRTKYGTVYLP